MLTFALGLWAGSIVGWAAGFLLRKRGGKPGRL